MGDSSKVVAMVVEVGDEEKERLIDFDMLCSKVAMNSNNGKWNTLHESYENDEYYDDEESGELGGGVFRMWEGDMLDCFDDRRLFLQSSLCPWYRFGENMRLAGFGSCFLQGFFYIILATIALCNFVAFAVTKKHCFLYLGVAFVLSLGTYLGFHRIKMRNKFNIKGSDSSLDDCVSHLICPCCTLAQESRTLEINNVHDGTWHGRGDTMCIGTYVEGVKAFELIQPSIASINSPKPCLSL
ncbi:PLAC8 family protein [Artemisia annua]|uniref:PLAC8 family protein n=1 Tax=Artemisia annua TaxID=35608 RepID=A0A2U1N8D5_ARTAN|nr:PLAC8 family protein [Artemisia annua]